MEQTKNSIEGQEQGKGISHELKTWSAHFKEILTGRKTFEVRKNDRDYKVGDTLILIEGDLGGYGMTDHDLTFFPTGRKLIRQVTHILHGNDFGIENGYCVMSFVNPATTPISEVKGELYRSAEEILKNNMIFPQDIGNLKYERIKLAIEKILHPTPQPAELTKGTDSFMNTSKPLKDWDIEMLLDGYAYHHHWSITHEDSAVKCKEIKEELLERYSPHPPTRERIK